MPTRSSSSAARPSRPRSDLLDLTLRLQPRDLVIAQLLDEHRTLTTGQITAMLFGARATAAGRLYALRRADWIDRFIRVTPIRNRDRPDPARRNADRPPGADVHWVLGPSGARWAALHAGRKPPTPAAARERRHAIAASPQLSHTDGANQVFVDLIAAGRVARTEAGAGHLARWWSAAHTAAALGQRVHPDGHGVWESAARPQMGFFLEYDTGTESLDRLVAKIAPYERLQNDGGARCPVLFWLPGPAREANLHRAFATHPETRVFVATTTSTAVRADASALAIVGPVWRVVGDNPDVRLSLIDLPGVLGAPGPFAIGAAVPAEDPIDLLGELAVGPLLAPNSSRWLAGQATPERL